MSRPTPRQKQRQPLPLDQCGAFIFDMDGTLTVPQHDFDAIRDALNIPTGVLILEYLDSLPKAMQRHKRNHLNQIEAEIAGASEPAPGLFELLDRLKERTTGFGLLTRNSSENALISLDAIGALHYFDASVIVGRDEAAPKPDPAGIAILAARLGVENAQCAMVGDYRHDLEAAAAAGAHSVHVRHPNTPVWPEFTDTTVNNLQALTQKLI